MPTLSVLDQSPLRQGGTAEEAIHESLQLAGVCDRLGYHRYWVAEHHSSGGLAGASPEILIGAIAGRTQRLRVGSGGVMLSHYSPLKVAEQFRMLEALHPGRIDLGIGRAPGSDRRTALALSRGVTPNAVDDFPDLLEELEGYLTDSLPADHPFSAVKASPEIGRTPELWLLGSTTVGAELAAKLGWAFSFAHFISPDGGENVIREYRRTYQPSALFPEPRASIGVSVTCADTHAEAERLCWSRWASRIMANHGQRRGVPPPDEAINYPFLASDLAYLNYMRERSIYGTPAECKARLLALGEEYGVDEFVVVTITYDFAARVRSYELLADAFGIGPRV